MQLRHVMLSASVLLAPAALGQSIEAGPIVNPANGHTYYRLTVSTWTSAEAAAQALGGHLATINDAAENEWVRTTFTVPGGGRAWIGLVDPLGTNGFGWVSGSNAAFRQWEPGEPNFIGSEHWVEMYGSGNWNNQADFGTGEQKGIVEVDARYTIDWFTIDDGGSKTDGGVFTLGSTSGQHDATAAGTLTGGPFTIAGGFWAGISPVAKCNDADVAGLGGSIGYDGRLTADDVIVFLAAFFAGDYSIADLAQLGGAPGADGRLTADDVILFLSIFFSPCT